MSKQYVKYSDCEVCHGSGMVACSHCHGEKRAGICPSCHGAKRKGKCKVCDGTGSVPCFACEGSGLDYDFDPPVKCKVCNGTRKQVCKACNGTKLATCTDCHGTGKELCHKCAGTGVEQCPKCKKRAEEDEKKREDRIAAAKAAKAKEARRIERRSNLCRGLWWFLFRVAAAATFFSNFKDSYSDISENTVFTLALVFFAASYSVRQRFGGVWYFVVGLAVPIVAVVVNDSYPMTGFCLFTVMVTFFMRWMGEKLKLPLITYPLIGAMVGFCTSPFSVCHNVFRGTPWSLSAIGLAILFFCLNIAKSEDNGRGVVVAGPRQTSWKGTFWLLAICAVVSIYIGSSANGDPIKFKWNRQKDKTVESSPEASNGLSMYEQGVAWRDGIGCEKDIRQAEICFCKGIKEGSVDSKYALADLLLKTDAASKGKTAILFLKQAAEASHVDAMALYGQLLLTGKHICDGVEVVKDEKLAVKYLTMAAEKGNANAVEELKKLKK